MNISENPIAEQVERKANIAAGALLKYLPDENGQQEIINEAKAYAIQMFSDRVQRRTSTEEWEEMITAVVLECSYTFATTFFSTLNSLADLVSY